MQTFQTGQKSPLAALTPATTLTLGARVTGPAAEYDLILFGLDDAGRLSDDRYMVFYNQPRSPEGALSVGGGGNEKVFTLDLAALPAGVRRLSLAVTTDGGDLSSMQAADVTLSAGGAPLLTYRVTGRELGQEKALMLLDVYFKDGWRVGAVGQGFAGGLGALVRHFGGEVAGEGAAPAPAAPASAPSAVSLVKERQRVLLEKAERTQPQLVNLIKTASVSLEKRGLGEARYRVNLVLDISASMYDEYRSGAVQSLAERALALAARLDDDGEVEVYLFGIKAHRRGALSLDNVGGFVDRLRVNLEGGTHYSPVMTLVREDARAAHTALPTLVLFITDGGSSNRDTVVRQMTEASREPVFWKFMGIDQGGVDFDFLTRLDDLRGRTVDNADFFSLPAPIRVPDAQLFELLVNELDTWQAAARRQGILR
ncbi:VWA domain-containing protein [Deinococcus petrolearius]|uniref:VWA domain-containing protein n=1 Tax=Deinococcus petrolearius TaxID=1751295 RepID=A0ABW1DEW7_9DEIO